MNFVFQSTFQKTNTLTWHIAGTTAIFSILFHNSEVGLNLGIFSVLLLGYWAVTQSQRFRNWQVFLPAAATLATAIAEAWYGTEETILWNFICLLILSRQIYFPGQSLLLSELKSFLNLFIAPVQGVKSLLGNHSAEAVPTVSKLARIVLFVVLPLGFTWIFAGIYSQLNPYFEQAYDAFIGNLEFSLLLTILLGGAVAFILLRPVTPIQLAEIDHSLKDDFTEAPSSLSENQKLERQVGVILFSLLNLMLTLLVISDIFFLQKISTGQAEDYSKYVHQGVELLIFSIVIATSFILYFFRNAALSRLSKNDWLKALAIVWVMLNIGILATTAIKNGVYIGEYSLSLKRVGVFIYLLLAASGLSITLVKLYRQKTNAFLFRQLYWSFFLILTVNICIDWSSIITGYNIRQHTITHEPLDWDYLLSLDERVLPVIYYHQNQVTFENEQRKAVFERRMEAQLAKLYQYDPEWREISLARSEAKSKLYAP